MPKLNVPKYLIIHHEGSNLGFEKINEWHRQRWNFVSSLGFFIGYHYYIEKSGKSYQGRRDNEEGAHTIGYNTQSLGICCQGNFEIEFPTTEQINTLKKLLEDKSQKYLISKTNIKGHSEISPTLCPGKNLLSWVKNYQKIDLNYLQKQIEIIKEKIRQLLELLKVGIK